MRMAARRYARTIRISPAGPFRAVVEHDLLRQPVPQREVVEEARHPGAGYRNVDNLAETEPAVVLGVVQHAVRLRFTTRPSRRKGIVAELTPEA